MIVRAVSVWLTLSECQIDTTVSQTDSVSLTDTVSMSDWQCQSDCQCWSVCALSTTAMNWEGLIHHVLELVMCSTQNKLSTHVTTLHCAVTHCTVLCCDALHCVLCCDTPHCVLCCVVLWHTTLCAVLCCDTPHCVVLWHTALQCAVLCCDTPHCVVLWHTALQCVVLWHTALCCAVTHCTAVCCAVTHCTVCCAGVQKICEKPQVVNEYENGKAIPNQAVISKLERALGTICFSLTVMQRLIMCLWERHNMDTHRHTHTYTSL